MQIRVNRKQVSQVLRAVSPFVPCASLYPTYNQILVFANGDALHFYAYDGYSVHAEGCVSGAQIDGGDSGQSKACVNVRTFVDLVDASAAEELVLEFDGNRLGVAAGNGKWELPSARYVDVKFPEFEGLVKGRLPDNFPDLLKMVLYAVAKSDERPTLRNVLFELDEGSMRLTAVDGFRLAQVVVPMELSFSDDKKRYKFMVRHERLSALARQARRFSEPVYMKCGVREVVFETAGYRFALPLEEGRYPDLEPILGPVFEHAKDAPTRVSRQLLCGAVRRGVIAYESDSTPRLCIHARNQSLFGQGLEVSLQAEKMNQFEFVSATVPVEFSVLLNAKYLLAALEACKSDEVRIYFLSSPRNFFFVLDGVDGDSPLHLIMPMAY
jgi:DNA polymerase-3 subunit beta